MYLTDDQKELALYLTQKFMSMSKEKDVDLRTIYACHFAIEKIKIWTGVK